MNRSRRISGQEARGAAARAVQSLAADARVRLVFLFGSAADPDRVCVGDVDLAVLFDRPLSFDELMRLRADLMAAVSAEIDLVSLNDAPVVLAHEVAESGRCLYARDPDAHADFVTHARAAYWDFKPYLDEQWRLAGERLEERRRGSAT